MSNCGSSLSGNDLNCVYQNVRGLNTKTEAFYNSICHSEYDLIGITESWIQDNIFSTKLFDDRYVVFRHDRDLAGLGVSRGGGVILAVKRELKATPIDLHIIHSNVRKVDIVGCKLHLNFSTLYFLVIYIPPLLTNNEFMLLFECIETLKFIYGNNLVIMGDFNVPNFFNQNINDQKVEILNNFSNLLGIDQFNDVVSEYNSVLDLVFSNVNCRINREQIPLVNEDRHHPSLNISLSCKGNIICNSAQNFPVNLTQIKYNFRKANFPLLYDTMLKVNWESLYSINGINEACSQFYKILFDIFDQYVPKSVIRKRTFPPWFTRDIIKSIKRKHRIFKKLKRHKSEYYQLQYSQIRRNTKNMMNAAYINYISQVENSISSDPSSFWSFINSKKSTNMLPDVLKSGDSEYSDPKEVSNAFADFFSSVYSTPSTPNSLDNAHTYRSNTNISLDKLSDQSIMMALTKLKNRPTCGPDGVPCFFVRDCRQALIAPLSFLFNLSLKSMTFPDIWKETRITPVFKKGDSGDITNYRPVSILSAFAKVFEISIYKRIFAQVKDIISDNQHGFFNGRSTISNLACFTQFTGQALDGQKQVDVIYTDFSKAFDRVDHLMFLQKLVDLGFNDSLVCLFKSYLYNRTQYVEIRGHKSNKFRATSGTPQGSNLAPLIFSLFINDIKDGISSNMLLFADDLKLFRIINGPNDCLALQQDVESIKRWCDLNKLPLNISKCHCMTFSNKLNNIQFQYKMENTDISRCNNFKDLGITFDPKLSFVQHTDQICKDSLRMLGFILRNSGNFNNTQTLITLYHSFVISKLEYGAIIWHPIHQKYRSQLESVQRKFVKYLAFREDGVFPPRGTDQNVLLTRFQLPSLSGRRIYHLLHFLIKLCKSLVDCSELLAQVGFHVPSRSVRQSRFFHLTPPSTNFLIRTPLFQAMSTFNRTCEDIDINNLSCKQISMILRNRFCKCG